MLGNLCQNGEWKKPSAWPTESDCLPLPWLKKELIFLFLFSFFAWHVFLMGNFLNGSAEIPSLIISWLVYSRSVCIPPSFFCLIISVCACILVHWIMHCFAMLGSPTWCICSVLNAFLCQVLYNLNRHTWWANINFLFNNAPLPFTTVDLTWGCFQ